MKKVICEVMMPMEFILLTKGNCNSDQGRNFESAILFQTLQAFGVQKSQTAAYHLQGDGMVEYTFSLLQLLHLYVNMHDDWEC